MIDALNDLTVGPKSERISAALRPGPSHRSAPRAALQIIDVVQLSEQARQRIASQPTQSVVT